MLGIGGPYEPVLDAIALVRASITYDRKRSGLAHREPDLVRDWLLTFARAWLLEWAGLREVGAGPAVEAALDYLVVGSLASLS